MLGVTLLYVGMVLINNGVCRLLKVDGRSTAVANLFTGFLSIFINAWAIIQGDYYAAGTGLLFGFTYLFVAAVNIFQLSLKPYGVYSLFVTINTVPCAIIALNGGDWRMCIIWLLWGVLWLTGFLEGTLEKNIGKFVPYLAIFEGVATAWVPGFLMLAGFW